MQNDTFTLDLIGVPLDLGAENLGVDIGPQAFRYQKITEKLEHVGFLIHDKGNIHVKPRKELEVGDPRLRYVDEIVRVNEELASITHDSIAASHKVLALGGDHSINLGVFSGAASALDGNLGMIYIDAHGDMNTDESTLSGNIHGMHLAALMGFGSKQLTSVHHDGVKLAKDKLLHIGGSDWDAAELDLINKEQLRTFTLFDLMSQNLSELLKMVDQLNSSVSNIWVSMDLDAIDRIYAPGAGMPNPKGLTYREITTIAEYIGTHCNVVGMDIVEYNPLQDEQNKTAELGIELAAKFFGKEYSWYTNYMDRNHLGI